MRNLKVKLETILKPIDISLAVALKFIADLHHFFKQLSPIGSIAFIFLNIKRLFVSWKPLLSVALLVPALLIMPSFDIVRFMFSVCILWIFFDKLNNPAKEYSTLIGALLVVYVLAMAAGILNPSFYLAMDTYAMRYRFIMESHNGLTLTALLSLVYLMNVFLTLDENGKMRWLKWASYMGILLLFIVFLFIKSRIYIIVSFSFVLLIGIKKYRSSKALALAPVWYILLFTAMTFAGHYLLEYVARGFDRFDLLNNQRFFSLHSTGRDKLLNAFITTFKEEGWQHFIYQNNVAAYYQNKVAIPGINPALSTLTESSPLVILLYTGFLGLLVFFFIFAHYLVRFIKRREWTTLVFFFILMGAWMLEEAALFPLVVITQFLGLSTINRLETKKI